MAQTPTSPEQRTTTLQDLDTKLSGLAIMVGVLLAGLVVLFAQVNAVPDLTAERVPSDNSGMQADMDIGAVADDVTHLRATVDAMSAQITAICAAMADQVPKNIIPNPCSHPIPTPAP